MHADATKLLWDACPAASRIVAFRNILIHGYASVDNRLVWGVVDAQLPDLAGILAALLAEA